MRTVECLRGRLLAERQASKAAKQDAHLLESKLLELENKLQEETKLRNKAEKRLKLLNKKLQSLKLLPGLEESERSTSSASSAVSSVSSASSSGTKDPQESASMSPDTAPKVLENVKENAADTKSDTKESSSSSSHEVPQIDHTSSSSSEISAANYEEGDEYVDNSLALVPLELPKTKAAPEIHIVSKSVGEVLDSLRHARERIQSSMGRRQMIRVGPS